MTLLTATTSAVATSAPTDDSVTATTSAVATSAPTDDSATLATSAVATSAPTDDSATLATSAVATSAPTDDSVTATTSAVATSAPTDDSATLATSAVATSAPTDDSATLATSAVATSAPTDDSVTATTSAVATSAPTDDSATLATSAVATSAPTDDSVTATTSAVATSAPTDDSATLATSAVATLSPHSVATSAPTDDSATLATSAVATSAPTDDSATLATSAVATSAPTDDSATLATSAVATSAPTDDSVTATTSAVATSAPTDDSATLATSAVACTASSSPQEEEETDSSETPSSDEMTRDSSRRRYSTGTVREAMQAGGMYEKCPPESKLLVGFKNHLIGALQVQNCQQAVDNVSRFLRYMQPEGEPNLEFLTKTTETMDYMRALNNSGLCAATILNYMKNIIRFLQYLKGSVDMNEDGIKIQKYIDYLKTIRKPVTRKHSGNVCSTRYDRIVEGMPTVRDCNLVLRSGKKRFLDIYNRMAISKIVVSPTDKTWYRYYCEAVMMLRHFQRPGVVEGMTVTEWVNRKLTDGRYLICIKNHKTGATHVATIALTLEEEAWYQGYYEFIRPEFVRGECDCFFLSARGIQITSGSIDLLRLRESFFSCGIDDSCTSVQVRRAAETLVETSFTETQKQNVAAYMCHSDHMADKHYRMPVPSTLVATAVLLDTLPGYTPDCYLPTETDSPGSCMSGKEFSDFQQTFPVSRDCQPPTKKQRVEAGFS
ncbi:uncharacterized protein LOC117536066 [Gymnodraco acuticeps]|uniref:Uncharacterized protein LOC117536066 n=1 Tax=Gymnodraco acuticeps TaxID=8218 RepID=A0A6P8SZT0_GYMAC|nr:uncharacterized protein LOC117536066 [Gymnodraco acuticeps]